MRSVQLGMGTEELPGFESKPARSEASPAANRRFARRPPTVAFVAMTPVWTVSDAGQIEAVRTSDLEQLKL